MSTWWHDLGLFIGEALANWVLLVTGSICLFLVGLYERWKGDSLRQKHYLLILGLLALYSVFSAWRDEHANTQAVLTEKASLSSQVRECSSGSQVKTATIEGQNNFIRALQEALAAIQGPQMQQQANIGTCVAALTKLNPVVHEAIYVVQVPFARLNESMRVVGKQNPARTYVLEIFIVTNEMESRVDGRLKCDEPFTPMDFPQLPDDSRLTESRDIAPDSVSDREYQIRVQQSGVRWGPTRPVFMQVRARTKTLGICTFTSSE